ncbi:putative NTF2-like domain superfamily protein [Septoria linicola]|nr:putative NTF2-like domain superfamily protein [Septoria linicola]
MSSSSGRSTGTPETDFTEENHTPVRGLSGEDKIKLAPQSRLRELVDGTNNNDPTPFDDMFDEDFHATVLTVQPPVMNAEQYMHYLFVVKQAAALREHIVITNMSTTVDLQRRMARTFMDFDVRGVHDGIVRQSVAVIKFRVGADGQWRCLKYEAADSAREMIGI